MYRNIPYPQLARLMRLFVLAVSLTLLIVAIAAAAPGESAPNKGADEGEGPHARLILRGVNLINGEGAPVRGPVDIVIEQNRITNIVSVGHPGVPIKKKVGQKPTLTLQS